MGELVIPKPSRWLNVAFACGAVLHVIWIGIIVMLLAAPDWDRPLRRWIAQHGNFGRPEPTYFIALGYELNFGIYCFLMGSGATAVFFVLHQKHAKRVARRRSGQCWSCGYDLRGSTANECSECGSVVRIS